VASCSINTLYIQSEVQLFNSIGFVFTVLHDLTLTGEG